MPKIQWSGLPEALRKHLLLRLKERQATEQDLLKLMEWRQSDPEAPDGPWYEDFGSFKVCGEDQFPNTFLLKGQPAKGEPLLREGLEIRRAVLASGSRGIVEAEATLTRCRVSLAARR